eukprot:13287885-Alexandrium_andersonii.AAC.1
MPWLPCKNTKVPNWWCARCHRSDLTHKALLSRKCWVGLAATERQLQQARLRTWAQPNKLVFWGASRVAERR